DGTFREVWPEESGIVVPGDARGAEAIDLNGDGRQDLAVAVNSGVLQVFIRVGR
ncbi:MAG: CRTAC1 family protein, partial [Akkermansiaceae bacterium]|nr:CRTAC1 family protein [Akkermansiaceae bacterium]